MDKFTPGPWIIGTPPPNGELTIGNQAGMMVAVATTGFCCQTAANARLIAAAPDLLEACQTFAEWLRREDEGLPDGIVRGTPEGEQQWRTWWGENLRICNLAQERARAAIARARGEA